jgi:hypothetical protein
MGKSNHWESRLFKEKSPQEKYGLQRKRFVHLLRVRALEVSALWWTLNKTQEAWLQPPQSQGGNSELKPSWQASPVIEAEGKRRCRYSLWHKRTGVSPLQKVWVKPDIISHCQLFWDFNETLLRLTHTKGLLHLLLTRGNLLPKDMSSALIDFESHLKITNSSQSPGFQHGSCLPVHFTSFRNGFEEQKNQDIQLQNKASYQPRNPKCNVFLSLPNSCWSQRVASQKSYCQTEVQTQARRWGAQL